MEYSEYTAPETNVSEYYVQMSDGVSLKMLDFQPGADSSNKPIILFVAGWISQLQGWKSGRLTVHGLSGCTPAKRPTVEYSPLCSLQRGLPGRQPYLKGNMVS